MHEEGLDNIANDPVHIAGGGDPNAVRARQRLFVDNRGSAIRAVATPPRESVMKA